MKKNVLIFGLIAGVINAIWMFTMVGYCMSESSFENGMILGFTEMILSLSLIFIAVKITGINTMMDWFLLAKRL
jgi:hypothetical protein